MSKQGKDFQAYYKELNMIVLKNAVDKNFDFGNSHLVNEKIKKLISDMQKIIDIEKMSDAEKELIFKILKFDKKTIALCKKFKTVLEQHAQIKNLDDIKSTVSGYIEVTGLLAKSEFIKHLKSITKEEVKWDFDKQFKKLGEFKNRL